MNRMICTLLITIVSSLFVVPAQSEIYKWTDSGGKVHFGDKVPASGNAETVDIIVTPSSAVQNPASTNETPGASSGSSYKPANEGRANKRVVMYSTAWCPYCKKARNYFRKTGIRFVEYDVEKLPNRMREFKKLGGTGYPLILIGKNQQMQGFSVSGFDRRYNRQPK